LPANGGHYGFWMRKGW